MGVTLHWRNSPDTFCQAVRINSHSYYVVSGRFLLWPSFPNTQNSLPFTRETLGLSWGSFIPIIDQWISEIWRSSKVLQKRNQRTSCQTPEAPQEAWQLSVFGGIDSILKHLIDLKGKKQTVIKSGFNNSIVINTVLLLYYWYCLMNGTKYAIQWSLNKHEALSKPPSTQTGRREERNGGEPALCC